MKTYALILSLAVGLVIELHADSAKWNLSPITGEWGAATNWTPVTVPNGPRDTATFGVSNWSFVTIAPTTQVNGIVFEPGATAFHLAPTPGFQLTVSGVGITNNSTVDQTFVVPAIGPDRAQIVFTKNAVVGQQTVFIVSGAADGSNAQVSFSNDSSAGDGTFITNTATGPGFWSGVVQFVDNATAGQATLVNNASPISGQPGGTTYFYDGSTAGNAVITNKAALTTDTQGGVVEFFDHATAGSATITTEGSPANISNTRGTYFVPNSTAGNATIIAEGGTGIGSQNGGLTEFEDGSTAGNANLIATGGSNRGAGGLIRFNSGVFGGSSGGTARIAVFGNGKLDVEVYRLTVGSIEGNGEIEMGVNSLTVGSNNLDTIFDGVISGIGSLTKIGSGTLVLSNANTYTGTNNKVKGTSINFGTLLVTNTMGSGTGAGPVRVKAGTLGGTGIIAGNVSIGLESNAAGVLSPGVGRNIPGTLTLQGSLRFNPTGTFQFGLNTDGRADQVIANGIIIENGAQFASYGINDGTLASGTVFVVISNTAATPISGTFANIPDGSTITVGSNTFQANYEGGDGNDLTLTVVP